MALVDIYAQKHACMHIPTKLRTVSPCSYEMVQKKLKEVALARGKTSSMDRAEHIEMLTYLSTVAKGPVQVG